MDKLYKPAKNSNGEDNGQITIIGGSSLFHGAPLLSLKAASRIVDMVFFTSPEKSLERVSSKIKADLFSFIWVPWEEVDKYIEKSEAVLIGPGFMRFSNENNKHHVHNEDCDEACEFTKGITEKLLKKFPNKKWVIDAGSLQTMSSEWIPKDAILTPNKKEFEMLFNVKAQMSNVKSMSKKYKCVIVLKGLETLVCSSEKCEIVRGGNAGMTKGGTGDVQAGLTVALLAKNEPFLAAKVAAQVVKDAADSLYKKQGIYYNADDLADEVPVELARI